MRSIVVKSLLFILPIALFGCVAKNINVGESREDSSIKSRVESILLLDSQLPNADVKVQVSDRIVKLDGNVTNFRELHRVVHDTKKILGVRGVIDSLKVVPGERGDDLILDDVQNALKRNSEIPSTAIMVQVSNGEITLTGKVTSYLQKQLVEDVAENTYGASRVDNQLEVVPLTQRSDREIKSDIERLFQLDRLVKSNIIVDVKNGVVILMGKVRTFGEFDSALEDASIVRGVRDVVNHLTLAP